MLADSFVFFVVVVVLFPYLMHLVVEDLVTTLCYFSRLNFVT